MGVEIQSMEHCSLNWPFGQNADKMTVRMLQILQEFDWEIVHRAGATHDSSDGFWRQIPDEQLFCWQHGGLQQLVQP